MLPRYPLISTDWRFTSKYRPKLYVLFPTSTQMMASSGVVFDMASKMLAESRPLSKRSVRRRAFSCRQIAHRSVISGR